MANRRFIDFPIASTVGDSDIILIWQSGANKQTTKATFLSGLPENLDELNDVAISGLTNGQILRYDSVTGKWENTDQGNLDLNDLNDVSIVSPSNGQVLVYNSSTSKWENSSGGFVPYVGAVTTVDLGAQGLRAGYVRFDTTVAGVPNEQGLMFWDADDETVDIILNGYTMKIGEDLFYPVKNQTGSTIAKGVAVRFNGTVGNSGRLLIAPFIADGSVPSSRFMGVTAEEILNGEDGKVLYFGRVRGINTNAFNEGDILYASTTVAGGYQTAIPVAPNNIVQVAAVVTKSATVGTIFVRPTLGSNINKDEGVKIVSVADKNLLQYQSGTSLWENKTLAQVIGGTSAQFVKGDGSLDSSTYGTGTVTSVGLSSATNGVTIGSTPVTTSGTITLAIATASGSQNGLLSSSDWTTFNNKQNALTNPVTGTGTSGQIAYFTGTSAITSESGLTWDATNNNLSIGGATANSNLTVSGSDNTDIFTVLSGANSRLHVGTVTSPSISTYIRSQNNYALNLGTNSTNYLTILSSGNVGVNTATPATAFEVNGVGLFTGASLVGNTKTGLYILDSNIIALTNGTGPRNLFIQAENLSFYTGSTYGEKMKLFSDGNLLIQDGGTFTNNGARLQVSGTANFVNTINPLILRSTNATTMWTEYYYNTSTLSGYIGSGSGILSGANASDFIIRSQADLVFTSGGNNRRLTITSSGNVLIGTTTDSGSSQSLQIVKTGNSNYLRLQVDNNAGLDSALFFTDNTNSVYAGMMRGSSGLTGAYSIFTGGAVRLNVTSSGNVLIGTQTDNGNKFQVSGNATISGSGNTLLVYSNNNSLALGVGFQGVISGYIGGISSALYAYSTNGGYALLNSSSAWVPASDVKRKRNFEDYNLGLDAILGLKPKYYHMDFQNDKEQKQVGLVAQEVKEFIPQAFEQNADFIGLNYNAVIVTMVKAIQDLKQEIDTLKN